MERIENGSSNKIRVSVATMALIQDTEGRIALLINKNRAENGKSVLTPIGGAVECTDEGKKELISLLGIREDDFEKGNDLRFLILVDKIEVFKKWFLGKSNREMNPGRELHEELVDEEAILSEHDLEGAGFEQVGYYSEEAITNRKGREGVKTLRIAEVFQVILNQVVIGKLSEADKVRFVTKEEVLDGKTIDGVDIGSISKCLVEYRTNF